MGRVIGNSGGNWFAWNVVAASGGGGNAGGECLDIRLVLGDALVCGLAADVVCAAHWAIAISPHGRWDVAVCV